MLHPHQNPAVYFLMVMVIINLAAVFVFDYYAWRSEMGRDATISATLSRLAHEWPIIPLGVGLFLGHLFW